jgi:hypothetical protein
MQYKIVQSTNLSCNIINCIQILLSLSFIQIVIGVSLGRILEKSGWAFLVFLLSNLHLHNNWDPDPDPLLYLPSYLLNVISFSLYVG